MTILLKRELEVEESEPAFHHIFDPSEYFNSLIWIKENDPSELELAFQVKKLMVFQTILKSVVNYILLNMLQKGG